MKSSTATALTVVGFLLAGVSIFSLFMNMVAVDLFFLTWLQALGPRFLRC